MAQVYACSCLNVRLLPTAQPPQPPDQPEEPQFTVVYVGDDGIRVAHPHLTLRTRTRGLPIEGTTRCARYTTLTCLICDLVVYRIYQVISIDMQGKDGPLLPTDEWVEDEIMKSSSGWIQVGTHCLTDDAVQAAVSSPDYSPLFSVVLTKLPPPSPLFQDVVSINAARAPSPRPPVSYLEKMKPLFPPAPFTPSHPVFAHLADTAAARSATLRAEAEECISRIVKDRTDELEKAEDELREQVDALWLKFKMTVDAIKKDREKPKTASSATRAGQEPASDTARPSPVAIKEFVPVAVSPARALSPPRISALSASLAASSFHHPRALSESHASARETNGSIHSRSSQSSERSGSATCHLPSRDRESAANVLQFPRNIDDNLNTAVSFKYFVDLEYEMQRRKKDRLAEVNREHRASQSEAGPSQEPVGPVINGQKAEVMTSQERAELQVKHVQVDTEGSVMENSEKSPMKGKRHVTFDVEPEVVTIDGEAKKSKAESSKERELDLPADMIFELEELDGDGAESSTNAPAQTLPLLEQTAARPARHRKVKSLSSAGLPSSFSSLRPLSLPGPSQIRPPRSPHGIDTSSQNVMMSLPKQTTLDKQKRRLSGNHTLAQVPEEELDPRDAVILRLVAADTPSHRGAWKPDSEAWKSLTQPRGSADVSEDEEGEDGLAVGPSEQSGGDDSAEPLLDESDYRLAGGVPGSVPIPIAPISKQKRPLSLASYQPATLTHVPLLVSKHHQSTAAMRRASYAERDRLRAMDPGALDFATEDDEEAGESTDEEAAADVAVSETDMGTRSRRRALRILQKRSEIPEEGMWRSLAV